ncbi:MAG: DUF3307 domain-containing protein [Candidatus Cyclobacteriaceae bacterium M3_2C_046]
MIILVKLLVAHLLTDFVFQPSGVRDRFKKRHKSWFLYVHGILAGLLAYLLAGYWKHPEIFLVISITHILIDLGKSYFRESLSAFIIDQVLHILVILVIWIWLREDQIDFWQYFLNFWRDMHVWTILLGYITIIWPMGHLVAYATRNWRNEIEDEGLYEAGKRIGQLERTLILTFVLIGRYEAIGFLIAAKSVFRFSQIQSNKERKVGEYILIGTMFSFAISIIIGLLVKQLIS